MINSEQLQRESRIATIMYSVNFAAIFIYFVIAWMIKQNKLMVNVGSSAVDISYLRYIFYILSVGSISIVPLLPRFFLSNTAKIKNQEMLLGKLKTLSILRGSIAEFPAVLGFISFLLSRQELDFHILCGISFTALIIFLPRRQTWEEFMNKYPQLS